MRIAQIVSPDASHYEKKCQRIDAALLSERISTVADADLAHVYGSPPRHGLEIPYVASRDVARRRFALRRPVPPRFVVSPIAPIAPDSRLQLLPEVVDEGFFATDNRVAAAPFVIGSFARDALHDYIERTLSRIQRVRDDVIWNVIHDAPSPSDLRAVDVWVDPALREDDYDGFVAEALVCTKPVVASRTQINTQRLENGRTGFLVPGNDANELSHAILTALFKTEVAQLKIDAARQTTGKFRPRQRLRVLERIYEATVR